LFSVRYDNYRRIRKDAQMRADNPRLRYRLLAKYSNRERKCIEKPSLPIKWVLWCKWV